MKEKLHILQHALGLDQYGQGSQYRNYFVTDEGTTDYPVCMDLLGAGLMRLHPMNKALTGGGKCFVVTPGGIDFIALHSPKAPPEQKLTRSQKNYRAYLKSNCDFSFGEWMRFPKKAW
jgi:hypothetical protein